MSLRTFVVTLQPDANLSQRLLAAKSKLRAACGDQTYLAHPPHATLYVATFRDYDAVLAALAEVSGRTPAPAVQSLGWKVFENDALTGGNTVVCELSPASQGKLRPIQSDVLAAIGPLRDRGASAERYAAAVADMPDLRRAAVEQWGFPFVGDDWQPHFTVASVAPEAWQAGWETLREEPIRGEFHCPELRVYELERGFPVELAAWPLRG